MNWDDAKLLLAVAREGQMLGAARRLGTSQARLSRRIAALEERIGSRLLERTTRGSALTDDGRLLFEMAERIEAEMAEGLSRLNGSRGETAGTVRIGAPDGFGSAFLAPRLRTLTAAYPKLKIELVPTPRSFSLSRREADIAIMIGRPDSGRLKVRRLTDYTLKCYAARSYVDTRGRPRVVEDLRDHDLIGYVDDLIATTELSYASEIWRDWRPRIEISTAVGQIEAVRSGAGIGIVHDFMAVGRDDLVCVLPQHVVTRTYWMAWHENLAAARRVQKTAEFIAEEVSRARRLFRPAEGPVWADA